MRSVPETTAIRPGFRVIRGSQLIIPDGKLRITYHPEESPKLEIIQVQVSIQIWTSWLAIAFARLDDTRAARKRMAEAIASSDDVAESIALEEEFQGALQTVSAAVFALDAFYGIVATMIALPESERSARLDKRLGRAGWVADAIGRASRMSNEVRKRVTKNIHTAYHLRNNAVHPHYRAEEYGIHPGLNQAVPRRYADYTLETSSAILAAVVEALMYVTDLPQPKNARIATYGSTASTLLHEIVDKCLTYAPEGPFTRRDE